MGLVDDVRRELTDAMRASDGTTTTTLRGLLAAVAEAETAGASRRELSDDDVVGVVRAEVKKRVEAAELYRGAGRDDRAAAEEAEAAVLERFLPAQVSDADLDEAAAEALATLAAEGVTGKPAMGKAIGVLKGRFGTAADPKRIAAVVQARLG